MSRNFLKPRSPGGKMPPRDRSGAGVVSSSGRAMFSFQLRADQVAFVIGGDLFICTKASLAKAEVAYPTRTALTRFVREHSSEETIFPLDVLSLAELLFLAGEILDHREYA